jgi:hypothetical protein
MAKRFPKKPWKRLDAEMKGATGGLMGRLFGQQKKSAPSRLTLEQATELARLQLDSESVKAELQAFLYAWNGAIEFQGANPIAKSALSLNAFAEFLARVSITCRLPEFR